MNRLYLDCTHLHRAPAMNTGIERVVRKIAVEALGRSDLPFDIELAVLDRSGVFRSLDRVPALDDPPFARPVERSRSSRVTSTSS